MGIDRPIYYCAISGKSVTQHNTPTGADDITVPGGGWISNPGLLEAVRTDHMPLSILNKFDVIETNLTNSSSRFHRDYLTSSSWTSVSGNKLDQSDFPIGGMYEITGCGNKVTLEGTIRDVVIKADCKVQFSNGAALENMVLINTDTGASSVTASHVRLGVDDNCDPEGGAILILYGGFKAASGLEIYSSQILAQGDVEFSAQANGVEGGSIISAGEIDGASLTQMSGCPGVNGYAFYFPEYKLRG